MKTLLLASLLAAGVWATSCGNGNNEKTGSDSASSTSFPSDTTKMNSSPPDSTRDSSSSTLHDTSLTKPHP
ncbi:hypothetical protein [Deminuibacter soli]|uniref:Uncharacterized protein n=1 Tax=Deminuibacter soli TaxID=2291815 RepID=A0A3E1NIM0_9BACT|nr:hypothetical protein [Deminuibacter soli]RFM27762.1 hypothetical protein DXN05_13760 [Deminuibacter soli]